MIERYFAMGSVSVVTPSLPGEVMETKDQAGKVSPLRGIHVLLQYPHYIPR